MTRVALTTLSTLAALCCFAADAGAQTAQVWSDVDCGKSPIIAPSGLRCRATNEIDGSTGARFVGSSGVFRNWAAFGTKNGTKLYYLIYDTISPHASKSIYLSLEEEIKHLSSYAKDGRNFSAPASINGVDYSRFTGASGDACVAIRKPGPVQGNGYKWVLFANKCVPPGKTISDSDLGEFISSTGYRS